MAKKKVPHMRPLTQMKNPSHKSLTRAWDSFRQKKRRNIVIAVLLLIGLVFSFAAKKYYPAIGHPQARQVRINNLVTKSLKCDVIKMSPFANPEDVETITMAGVLLDLNSTAITEIEETTDPEANKVISDCLKPQTYVKLGSQTQPKRPYHTLTFQKGIAHFNFEAKSGTIEFSKRQDCLGIRMVRGKMEDGRIAFVNEDLVELTSNSEIICNSKTISQDQDWRIKLAKKEDLFLLRFQPRNEPHEINLYLKANSLKTPKHILAISDVFTTEIKNLLLTDAEGLISIGKERVKLEAYDVLEIQDTEAIESKFHLSILQLGRDGITIRANGSAANIRLNGTQLIRSKLHSFLTEPVNFPILGSIIASLLIIFSNLIPYILRKFFL